tara:strand:+ start:2008 stop:2517 length:510 start_codon:yes stop_codon:yes gene_type:complete
MEKKIRQILKLIILTFTLTSCGQIKSKEKMEWLTTNTEYERLPLYLRLPNYNNIWEYKSKYPELMCITHEFDSVKDNGLPTADYNETLIDFDEEVVNLTDVDKNGIIFLVETFGGARHYWFYIADSKIFEEKFDDLKNKNSDKKLELNFKNDSKWNFIKDYPVELYKSE